MNNNFIFDKIWSINIDADNAEFSIKRTDYEHLPDILFKPLFQYRGKVYFYNDKENKTSTYEPRLKAMYRLIELISEKLGIEKPRLIDTSNIKLLSFKSLEDKTVFMFYYHDKIQERPKPEILNVEEDYDIIQK